MVFGKEMKLLCNENGSNDGVGVLACVASKTWQSLIIALELTVATVIIEVGSGFQILGKELQYK